MESLPTGTERTSRPRRRKSGTAKKASAARPLGWLVVPPKRRPLFQPDPSDAEPEQSPTEPPIDAQKNAQIDAPQIRPQDQTRAQQARAKRRQHRLAIKERSAEAQVRNNYFSQTRRPIASLYFLLPLIVAYELGKIAVNQTTVYSGADFWVQQFLQTLSAGQLVILPMITTAVLLFWHHQRNDHWVVRRGTMIGMVIESLGMGLMFFVLANLYQILSTNSPVAGTVQDPYFWTIGSSQWWSRVMTFIGSGIHEELIFRVLIMLPLISFFAPGSREGELSRGSMLAIGISSFIFAAAHVSWFNSAGEPFNDIVFAFRFGAAVAFSGLFLYRGFAIAVGTHIIFNVLTLLSN